TKKVGGARSGSGRKPLQAGVATVPVMVKMTELQKEKLQRLGGASWVRARIDKAKEPTPKE
ncbi:MAG TPA: LexA family transcriptional regulator, partial [Variovorax sp.]|nr:LexA family transcriptional regulator [Variovorax sp.]